MSVLLTFFALVSAGWGQTKTDQFAALNAYIASKAKTASAPPEPTLELRSLAQRVDRLHSSNNVDYAAWLKLDSFLDRRLNEVRRASKLDVYADKEWQRATANNVDELCCMVLTTPDLANLIRQRGRHGKRPLPRGFGTNRELAEELAKESASK